MYCSSRGPFISPINSSIAFRPRPRLRSTFVDVAWHLRRIPTNKKERERERGELRGSSEERIIGEEEEEEESSPRESCGGQSQRVKRFQAAGVFGPRIEREMKISRRYLSPEKPLATPILRWPQINQWGAWTRGSPPKKMWGDQFYWGAVYRFIRNLK